MCDPQVLPGRAGLRHDHRRHDLAAALRGIRGPSTIRGPATGSGPASAGTRMDPRAVAPSLSSAAPAVGCAACSANRCAPGPEPAVFWSVPTRPTSMTWPSPADDYWGGVRRGCSMSDRFPVGSLTASPCRSHITCRRDLHDVPCGAETSIPTARRRAGADHRRAGIICTRPASCIPTRRCTSSRIKTGSTEAFCSTCCARCATRRRRWTPQPRRSWLWRARSVSSSKPGDLPLGTSSGCFTGS